MITEITDRFNDLVMQEAELRLKETVDGRSYRKPATLAPTSVVTEPHVYGRDRDKEAVLELLLSEKFRDAQVSVIPILGMGGIGKTTFAQILFNDEKVQSFFDLKAWACVSEDFDAVRVTRTILKSVTSESCEDNDLNLLQVKLKEKLNGQKYLVILDDVWNENYHDWTILRAPFLAGAPGSRIVITTRNQGVSSMTATVPTYHLQVLSNDACLSLFTQHALGASDFSAHRNLQNIGEKIVKRCKGLPLAAKTLGGLLRTKRDRDEWEDILKSKIWDIPEGKSGIVPALMLSYHHLPSHIKRCFAYCSILPKDYEFEEDQLVQLWMAEGLIQAGQGDKQMEDLGSEYFQDLLSRSFFQQSSRDGSQFLMHDLINDLAQWVAGDICFRMEDRIGGSNGKRLPKKARHSSYLGGEYDSTRKFEAFFELKCLRTFLPFMLPSPGQCYLTHNVPLQLLPKLRCLRVLSLNGYRIYELPDSIGDLKFLRYLDLSYTCIRGLPESTTTLCNLQTLILVGCKHLKELPSKLGNLVNLRHLNILNANKLEGMPPQIGKLTCLQTLSNLIVRKGNCFALKELGSLLHLRGTLIISRLENAIEPMDARDAKLIEKLDLTALCLEWGWEWSWGIDEPHDITSELEVLNMLQPSKALKVLTIRRYGGMKFPTWLKGHSFPHMVLLRIENCKKCTSLPPVGELPSLKHLFIEGMTSVKNVGHEFYGGSCSQPFESLETLCFKDMEEWESWSPNEEFPHLRELSIENCPKLLGKLPNHFPLLKKVLIDECQRLVVSISSFPELCELQIEGSKGVMCKSKIDFSSLKSKSLSTISEFTCPIEGFIFDVEDLAIENCEELTPLWSNDVGLLQPLPCLRVLRFYNCPKLVSLVAKEVKEQQQLGLPSTLREIYISHCNGMESLPKAMMYNNTCIESIYIFGCDMLTHFAIGQLPPTLKRLEISRCKNMLILLDGDDTNSCSSNASLLEYLVVTDCHSLKSLTSNGELLATLKHLRIHSCRELESTTTSFHHNSNLEYIEIFNCKNLKSLPIGIHTLKHLEKIEICSCSALVSFPDGGLLPSNLRKLMISNCEKMQAMMYNNTCVVRIGICKCDSLTHFAIGQLPPTLKWLEIHSCENMLILLDEDDNNSCSSSTSLLEYLSIWECPSLKSLIPTGELPATLKRLSIYYCPKMESIAKSFPHNSSLEQIVITSCGNLKSLPMGIHTLSHLNQIDIKECPTLVAFPDRELLPDNLTKLSIYDCEKIQALPNCLHNITSLQQLKIEYCPGIVSFPEEGFPTNLTSLEISDCNITEALLEWGLHRLTSLKELKINGGCPHLVSFPGKMLPSSLTSLTVKSFPNMKCLSSEGFRILFSLEELRIKECKNLTSFPEDGLPPSLQQLDIANCPLLKERCKKYQGQEWFKIAHIPCVEIDGRFHL